MRAQTPRSRFKPMKKSLQRVTALQGIGAIQRPRRS
jgi:hypothetical protein